MVGKLFFPKGRANLVALGFRHRTCGEKQMITDNRNQKPFHVGQLVKDMYGRYGDLALVLDLLWSPGMGEWLIIALHQRLGVKEEYFASDFEPVEKTNDHK